QKVPWICSGPDEYKRINPIAATTRGTPYLNKDIPCSNPSSFGKNTATMKTVGTIITTHNKTDPKTTNNVLPTAAIKAGSLNKLIYHSNVYDSGKRVAPHLPAME